MECKIVLLTYIINHYNNYTETKTHAILLPHEPVRNMYELPSCLEHNFNYSFDELTIAQNHLDHFNTDNLHTLAMEYLTNNDISMGYQIHAKSFSSMDDIYKWSNTLEELGYDVWNFVTAGWIGSVYDTDNLIAYENLSIWEEVFYGQCSKHSVFKRSCLFECEK